MRPPDPPPAALRAAPTRPADRSWADRYGVRHRWVRLADFPAGLTPPRKVRVYRRCGRYLLNWWDPAAGKNRSERVDGDLLAALARARQLDDRVTAGRTAGLGAAGRVGHADLVARYLADLGRRADAGEVAAGRSPGTGPPWPTTWPTATGRTPAGWPRRPPGRGGSSGSGWPPSWPAGRSPGTAGRGCSAAAAVPGYILAAVRAAFAWAADRTAAASCRTGSTARSSGPAGRPGCSAGTRWPPPTSPLPMAAAFLAACDQYEARLFAPGVLFGLRAAEPRLLAREHLTAAELAVPNLPELDYTTKGRRDKRFPLPAALGPVWAALRAGGPHGLLFVRRAVAEGADRPPLAGASLADLAAEYRARVGRLPAGAGRAARVRVRDGVLRDAGGLTYDDIGRAFGRVAGRLGWPAAATLKDFRHLFATALADAGVPDGYRKYWLGHAPGREAVVAYTHLAGMRGWFDRLAAGPWAPVVAVLVAKFQSAGAAESPDPVPFSSSPSNG
ncbi:MAG: hypothetical protein U0871_19880 [Gemmataceae bacterium]